MATTSITLTSEWVQITDGSQTATIQAYGYSFALYEGAEPPTSDSSYLVVPSAGITPPHVTWARAIYPEVTHVVVVR